MRFVPCPWLFIGVLALSGLLVSLPSPTHAASCPDGRPCVDSTDLINGQVDTADLARGAVTEAKLARPVVDRLAALEARLAALEALLAAVRLVEDPLNGLPGPHLVLEGVNVHLRSGSGATDDGCPLEQPTATTCPAMTGLDLQDGHLMQSPDRA